MKEVQGEAKAALAKVQENMKKYADRHRLETVEYKVRDLVLLSTKDLKWQMIGQRSKKLTERFVEPYKVKVVISSNAVCHDLPWTGLCASGAGSCHQVTAVGAYSDTFRKVL